MHAYKLCRSEDPRRKWRFNFTLIFTAEGLINKRYFLSKNIGRYSYSGLFHLLKLILWLFRNRENLLSKSVTILGILSVIFKKTSDWWWLGQSTIVLHNIFKYWKNLYIIILSVILKSQPSWNDNCEPKKSVSCYNYNKYRCEECHH